MKDYYVYKHTVPNGKVYIGITKCNPNKRWSNGHGYKENKRFFNDIILYGWLNVKHEILYEGLTEKEARETEARLIYEYQSYKNKFGYNQTVGYSYGYVERDNCMSREEYLNYCNSEDYKISCIPKSAKCKIVYKYDLDNNFICSYDSIGLCAKDIQVDKKNIRDCLKGKQKTCKGFKFSTYPPGKFCG